MRAIDYRVFLLPMLLSGCYGLDPTTAANGDGVGAGLPCDVQDVLSAKCQGCHVGASAEGGTSLASYDDLATESAVDPTMTVAERCVVRMQDVASPMPPSGAPATSAQIGVLQDWIAAAMPTGDCAGAGDDPLNAAPVCTSGSSWTGGNEESPLMNPGMACNDCHVREHEGPSYLIAGTVYPTGHEPNRCVASSAVRSAEVVITDAADRVYRLQVNAAGNFYLLSGVSFTNPYTAVVEQDGRQRPMIAAQTNGDCNACHTQSGSQSAPGRITLPY